MSNDNNRFELVLDKKIAGEDNAVKQAAQVLAQKYLFKFRDILSTSGWSEEERKKFARCLYYYTDVIMSHILEETGLSREDFDF